MNQPSGPLVSVVTPVYNTGEYLEEAIRSVLSQTHGNFEYIICNNHSTDGSGEIARRYAAQDARVRVVSPPEFLPQAPNWNYALTQIAPESRYVKVLCADDWLFPRCLSEMVACGEAHPSARIISSYHLVETAGEGFGLPAKETCISGRVACRLHLLQGIFLFGTPSTVMYRADVVRARSPKFYPLNRFFFDTEAVFQLLRDEDFGFVHQVLSFSRYQEGSITESTAAFGARALDRVLILHQYGRDYLTPEEFERSMSHAFRVYYEILGRQWLLDKVRPPHRKFWDFHRKHLGNVGIAIDPKRLAVGAAGAAARTALSPFELARDIVRSRRPVEDPRRS
jgi:glycosyltransferase involved in cell wall biosynthesis